MSTHTVSNSRSSTEEQRAGLTENKSLLTEKQNAHGTGLPVGPRTTTWVITLELVLSNACLAKLS